MIANIAVRFPGRDQEQHLGFAWTQRVVLCIPREGFVDAHLPQERLEVVRMGVVCFGRTPQCRDQPRTVVDK